MTAKVMAADGITAYQPTIAVIETRQLVVIGDVPTDVEDSDALLDAIDQRGLSQTNFAFGVRTGAVITIGLCADGECEFGVISEDVSDPGFQSIPVLGWWPFRNKPDVS